MRFCGREPHGSRDVRIQSYDSRVDERLDLVDATNHTGRELHQTLVIQSLKNEEIDSHKVKLDHWSHELLRFLRSSVRILIFTFSFKFT